MVPNSIQINKVLGTKRNCNKSVLAEVFISKIFSPPGSAEHRNMVYATEYHLPQKQNFI